MMELTEEERKIVERLAPALEEKLRYSIVRSLIEALEEQSYPPEELIRQEFIESIEEAEEEIKSGKSRRYSLGAFKKEFGSGKA